MGKGIGRIEGRRRWEKDGRGVGRGNKGRGCVGWEGGKRIRWWKKPDRCVKTEEGKGGGWGNKRHGERRKTGSVQRGALEENERTKKWKKSEHKVESEHKKRLSKQK